MLRHKSGVRAVSSLVLLLLLTVLACAPLEDMLANGGPSVEISRPATGARVGVGRTVEIASVSTSDVGIARVELLIDGEVVREAEPPEENLTTFRLVQSWVPEEEGEVRVSVIAYDAEGQASE
jgi:hypothetical protein